MMYVMVLQGFLTRMVEGIAFGWQLGQIGAGFPTGLCRTPTRLRRISDWAVPDSDWTAPRFRRDYGAHVYESVSPTLSQKLTVQNPQSSQASFQDYGICLNR